MYVDPTVSIEALHMVSEVTDSEALNMYGVRSGISN